jgi:hypothetical protein
LFSADGQDLLACCKDNLKIMTWEPISIVHEVSVEWNPISPIKDLKILPDNDHAIACSSNGSLVEVWGFQLNENSKKQGLPDLVNNIKDAASARVKLQTRAAEETVIQHQPESIQNQTAIETKPLKPAKYPIVSKTEELNQLSQISSSLRDDSQVFTDRPSDSRLLPTSQPEQSPALNQVQNKSFNQSSKFKYVPSCDGNTVLNLDLSKFVRKVSLVIN